MLSGIRIIELEGIGPAPFASMLLADLGAEVITVHRKGGSQTPGIPEKSLLDRGKQSIELDLKTPEDKETLMALLGTADGLIEGFRPGVMERLGFGPDQCHEVNERLVYGRMTGWGQDGPNKTVAGHDLNYISLSGALWYASEPGSAPITPATLVGDIGGGALYLVIGMLAGLMNSRATGKGTVVDAAIYDGSAHMMNLLMSLYNNKSMSMTRGQGILDGPHWCQVYRTKDDKFFSVQSLEPQFYAEFLKKMGLTGDPAFSRQYGARSFATLKERLAAIFAQKTRDEWADIFEGSDACAAPVLSPEEAAKHEMNIARKTWRTDNGMLQAAPAPRFSDQEDWLPSEIPSRGQHTDKILESLRSAGALRLR